MTEWLQGRTTPVDMVATLSVLVAVAAAAVRNHRGPIDAADDCCPPATGTPTPAGRSRAAD